MFINLSNHSILQSKHDKTQPNKIKHVNQIKNNKNTSYPKLRKSNGERLTLLMEHNLVDILSGPLVPTQQDWMIIKRIKVFNSS